MGVHLAAAAEVGQSRRRVASHRVQHSGQRIMRVLRRQIDRISGNDLRWIELLESIRGAHQKIGAVNHVGLSRQRIEDGHLLDRVHIRDDVGKIRSEPAPVDLRLGGRSQDMAQRGRRRFRRGRAAGIIPVDIGQKGEIRLSASERVDEGGGVDGVVAVRIDVGENLIDGAAVGGGPLSRGLSELLGLVLRSGHDPGVAGPNVLNGVIGALREVVAHDTRRTGDGDPAAIEANDLLAPLGELLGDILKRFGGSAHGCYSDRGHGVTGQVVGLLHRWLKPIGIVHACYIDRTSLVLDGLGAVVQVVDEGLHEPGVDLDESHDLDSLPDPNSTVCAARGLRPVRGRMIIGGLQGPGAHRESCGLPVLTVPSSRASGQMPRRVSPRIGRGTGELGSAPPGPVRSPPAVRTRPGATIVPRRARSRAERGPADFGVGAGEQAKERSRGHRH